MLRGLDSLDVSGKRVLLRVDFNVSGDEASGIADDYRVRATVPTIRELKRRGARAVLLLSHRGRPRGREERLSLAPVAKHVSPLLGEETKFVPECIGEAAETAAREASNGAVLLFENLRFHAGETANDTAFAQALARLGECYLNDAFGVSHREHASVVELPNLLPSAAGLLLQREVETLAHLREAPEKPFVVVLGGAKLSDKLPLVERFLPLVTALCLGGAPGNAVLKARGISIGRSRVDEQALQKLPASVVQHPRLVLPLDAVVARAASAGAAYRTCRIVQVAEDEMILDVGPETVKAFAETMREAKTIFWNGPMGIVEIPAFRNGTAAIAQAIASSGAFSVVGGGDTTRYPFALGIVDRIGFLSTGGGAMLEFLSGRALPGVEALQG